MPALPKESVLARRNSKCTDPEVLRKQWPGYHDGGTLSRQGSSIQSVVSGRGKQGLDGHEDLAVFRHVTSQITF